MRNNIFSTKIPGGEVVQSFYFHHRRRWSKNGLGELSQQFISHRKHFILWGVRRRHLSKMRKCNLDKIKLKSFYVGTYNLSWWDVSSYRTCLFLCSAIISQRNSCTKAQKSPNLRHLISSAVNWKVTTNVVSLFQTRPGSSDCGCRNSSRSRCWAANPSPTSSATASPWRRRPPG